MGKSRLFVFKLKDIIYISILILALIAVIVILFMSSSKQYSNKKAPAKNKISETAYVPGLYTSQLLLNDTFVNMEILVDNNTIKSISLTNTNDAVTAMYPLVETSVKNIQNQLNAGIPIDKIKPSSKSKYTETLLLESIKKSLETK